MSSLVALASAVMWSGKLLAFWAKTTFDELRDEPEAPAGENGFPRKRSGLGTTSRIGLGTTSRIGLGTTSRIGL